MLHYFKNQLGSIGAKITDDIWIWNGVLQLMNGARCACVSLPRWLPRLGHTRATDRRRCCHRCHRRRHLRTHTHTHTRMHTHTAAPSRTTRHPQLFFTLSAFGNGVSLTKQMARIAAKACLVPPGARVPALNQCAARVRCARPLHATP